MLYKSGFESTDYKRRFTAGSYLFSADPCEPPYSADDTREDFFSERGHERRRGVSRFDHFLWCQKGRGDLSVSSLDFKTTGAQSGHILTLHSLQLMNSYRQEADVCISWGWCRDASTLPSFKRLNDGNKMKDGRRRRSRDGALFTADSSERKVDTSAPLLPFG